MFWYNVYMSKIIKQTVTFKKTPHEVYEMLMDAKKHTAFTGAKAKINNKVGGKFSAYDGYCDGVNLELVPDKKIVQTWRASDWPEGHYSTATYELTKVKGGTKLSFTQKDVPEDQYADIKQGWIEFYWDKMKEYE